MDDSVAGRLGQIAESLQRSAERLEAQRFEAGVPDTTVKRVVPEAARVRALADSVRSRVGSREAVLAKRHAKRLLWLYAFCVDVVVCIFVGLMALGMTFWAVRARGVPRAWAASAVVALTLLSVPAALLFFYHWYDSATPPYALVEAAAGGHVLRLVRTSDGLHVLTVTLLIWVGVFAAPALPARPRAGTSTDVAELARAERELAMASRLFRLVLYVSAAMLVVYVAAISSLFQWVLAYVNPEPSVFAAVESMANSAVTARGLLASGLLVFGYGTSAAIVHLVALSLATRALPAGSLVEREAWVQEHGLVVTDLRQRLKTLSAILAPLLTGVLAQVLHSLA